MMSHQITRFLVTVVAVGLALSARRARAEPKYLAGHTEPVYAVAYAPDGRSLVSASFDRTTKIWARDTGRVVRTLADHHQMIMALAVSPDGKQLATSGLDRQVLVYEMPTAGATQTLAWPADMQCLAMSADGKWLAVAGNEGRIARASAESGQLEASRGFLLDAEAAPQAPSTVIAAASSADGARMTALNATGQFALWTGDGPRPAATMTLGEPVAAAALRSDVPMLAYGLADGQVRVVRPPTPAREVAIGAPFSQPVMAPDGAWAAAGCDDGRVRLVTLADGKAKQTLEHGASNIRRLAVRADGAQLASADAMGVVKLWRADGGLIGSTTIAAELRGMAFAGSRLCLAGRDGTVRLLSGDLPTGLDVAHGATPLRMATTADGARLATGDDAGVVRWIDAANGSVLQTWNTTGGPVRAVGLSADGQRIATSGDDGRLRLHSPASGGLLALEGQGAPATALAFDPAGAMLAAGDQQGQVKLWRLTDGVVQGQLAAHAGPVLLVAWSGPQLLTAAQGEALARRWNADGSIAGQIALGSPLEAAAISPDRQTLAAISADRTLRVVHTGSGQLIARWPIGAATSLAFSPRGDQLAVLGADAVARVFRAADGLMIWSAPAVAAQIGWSNSGEQLLLACHDGHFRTRPLPTSSTLVAHEGELTALAAVGDTVVTGGDDGRVKVWQAASGAVLRSTEPAHGAVRDLALSAAGDRLATLFADGAVVLAQVVDGGVIAELKVDADARRVTLSPDGKSLAVTRDDGSVRGVPLAAEQVAYAISGAPDGHAAWLNDGQTLALGGRDGALRLWTRPERIATAALHQGPVRQLAWSSGGGQVLSTGDDRVLVQSRASDLSVVRRLGPSAGAPLALAADLPGRFAALASTAADGQAVVELWQASDGQPLAPLKLAHPATALALADDGQQLHVASADASLSHYRLPTGTLLETKPLAVAATRLSSSVDGRQLLASAPGHGERFELASLAPRLRLGGHTAHVYALDFNAEGTRLASAGADQTVRLWNLADGANYATCKGHTSQVYAVAFRPGSTNPAGAENPAGEQLASGGGDRTIRLWSAADGAAVREWKEEISDGVYCLAFQRAGDRLFSGGLANNWQEWDPAQDKPLRTVSGHPDAIYRIALHPRGTRAATIGYQGNLFVWDLASGQALHHEQLPTPTAYSLAWSPDGGEIAIGTIDHRVLIWPVPEALR